MASKLLISVPVLLSLGLPAAVSASLPSTTAPDLTAFTEPGALDTSPQSSSPAIWKMPPFEACFHPDFPPSLETMAALNEALFNAMPAFNDNARWPGIQGEPITLRWSFAPDGLSIPSGVGEPAANNVLFARMDTLFGAANRAVWIAQFEACFARWGILSGINYVRVQNGANAWDDGAAWGAAGDANTGDIRISMKNIDGANGILAYNAFPTNGDMVIDSSENWTSGAPSYVFLRNTVMHEHGHGLGFAHTCPGNGTKLMEPLLNTGFDGPRQDEIRGVQYSYGDPNEPNNTATTPFIYGDLTPGVGVALGLIPSPAVTSASSLSIDNNGDVDWYRFTVDQPRLINVTLTPVGSSYLDLDQNANGSCQTTGTNINALAMADLRLDIYSSNGGALWRTVDATLAGANETVTGVFVSPGGNFHVRVSETGNPTEPQLYRMTVTAQTTEVAVSATDGTFPGGVRISWTTIPDSVSYEVRRNTLNSLIGATLINTGTATTFDDVTATPGVTYYYFVRVQQLGNTSYRDLSATGEAGFAPTPPNNAPNADAGPDQTVTDSDNSLSEPVTLNGSASTDPDGTITTYTWSEGPTQLASGPNNTAPVNLSVGVHVITLTVTDNDLAADTDTVTITVNAGTQPNTPPNADAGPDQTVTDTDNSLSETVTLTGAASTDPDGTITTYTWSEGPTQLASGPSNTASVPLSVGVHTITLTVTDDDTATDTDTVTITVNAGEPPCISDWDLDGDSDSDDVIAFFGAWEAGEGDADGDGDADSDDVIIFFAAWENGC